ncbi:hypothetical protein ACHAXR_005324 [Thalassiosira sp. AJA248-18]
MSPSLESPEILSLDGLKINLPQDVYNHLAAQYSILDERLLSSIHTTASSHLDKILYSMKTSPADTCCRVNLIHSSVEEVIEGLRGHISTIEHQIVRRHESIKDLVIIRAQPKPNDSDNGALLSCSVPPNQCNNLFPTWSTRADKGWPMSHRAVIVDRFCGEAVLRGANIFVRGILSADAGIAADEEIAVYADLRSPKSKSIPRGLVLENYSGRCVFLGMGFSCCKRSDYFSQSTGVGVRMSQIAGPPQPSLNSILTGSMMLQNLPSICVAHALDPQPGEVILDMCCAPGGKTTHLASLMNNEGMIIACDKSRKKMVSARDFFQSMGASCIIPLALDSTKSLLDDGKNWNSPKIIVDAASSAKKDGLLDIKGFYADSFDRILLDPPCSALGLRPKLLIDAQSSQELSKFATYQRRFVLNAIPLLKTGGTMTYSTCTINACENEDMVKIILSENPCMKLVPIPPELPGLPGLPDRGLTEEECQMVRRFDPCDGGDTMGFFLAKFIKVG